MCLGVCMLVNAEMAGFYPVFAWKLSLPAWGASASCFCNRTWGLFCSGLWPLPDPFICILRVFLALTQANSLSDFLMSLYLTRRGQCLQT